MVMIPTRPHYSWLSTIIFKVYKFLNRAKHVNWIIWHYTSGSDKGGNPRRWQEWKKLCKILKIILEHFLLLGRLLSTCKILFFTISDLSRRVIFHFIAYVDLIKCFSKNFIIKSSSMAELANASVIHPRDSSSNLGTDRKHFHIQFVSHLNHNQ
jgi:hypothetical protein